MGVIFLHQLRDSLRSLRFQTGLTVLLLFFLANGLIYTYRLERLAREDATIEAGDQRDAGTAHTVREALGQWYRGHSRPVGTEFIAEAGFNWFDDTVWASPESGTPPSFIGTVRTTNNWMRRYDVVDWSFIVRHVLSFLCLVLSYNAISGERERGTLRLALACPLSRGRLLMGKLLAHLVTLMAAVLVGSLLSLVVLALNGAVAPGMALVRGYLLFLLTTTIFVSLILLLGLGVSSLARSSASSLVLLLTAWTFLIVVIPQTSYLIATRAFPPTGDKWEEYSQYDRQFREALSREGLGIRPAELARSDGYAVEKRYALRLQELERELGRIIRRVEEQELQQYRLARQVNLLSPGFAYQYATEALLGAGLGKQESFTRQAQRYREALRDFFHARDAVDPASPHVPFLPQLMSEARLEPGQLPQFRETPLSLADSVATGVAPLVILVLETALAFFFSLWAFNRTELTD
jgi:ABC-type transport system involved in multi-copper enzyme maturation permease subunit